MRKPEDNTFNVYCKYLSGKLFSVKTNNPYLKTEIVGDVKVEENLQFIKVKIISTIKDNTLSKITVYQTVDQTEQVIINVNILALPYLVKTEIIDQINLLWTLEIA
ncbi:hypothetical protein [Mesoplasma melaleucae]|uniref:hypothetical protein n=1 Tax=Mesoplasma melaleucae TaxID=81459 RepID=UPI00048754D3|nr:hypothetical protein [Mesoplasma melaleucae]